MARRKKRTLTAEERQERQVVVSNRERNRRRLARERRGNFNEGKQADPAVDAKAQDDGPPMPRRTRQTRSSLGNELLMQ